jgi:hypothetical protein
MNQDHPQNNSDSKSFWGSRSSIGLVVLGGIALYFLLTEHRAHFFVALPFLLLLACPMVHFFMHGKHGEHGGRHDHQPDNEQHAESAAVQQAPTAGERS